MTVKSAQAVTVLFATANATTGAAADASSTPTGTLYVNGTANGASVTVTNITTGLYKAAVTLPSLTAGDIVSLRISATVATVAGEGVVWQDVSDTKRVSDLQDVAATAIVSAGAITTSSGAVSAVTTVTNLTNAPTAGDLTATMKTSITTAATAATPTAAAVTGAVGSVTGNVGGNVVGSVASVANIAPTGTGLTAIPWNAAWDAEVQSEAQDAITASALATAANLATLTGYVDTEVAAILADTNELQTDWVNGGRLDLLIDAVKAKTDNLPTDPADQSAVEAAITAATSPLATATAVADLPTNAELATALGTADDAVLAAIAALNNLSSAGAQSAAAAALTAYGAALQASVDDLEGRLTATRAGYLDNLSAGAVATAAALTAVDDYVDTEVAAIKAVTDKIDTALVLDGAVYQLTANALELAPTGGSAPTAVQIRQEIDSNSTQLAAIVADTDELQTDWANGGRLDLLLDGATAPTAAAVADAVWDEATSGHTTAGTTGKAIIDAQSAGDPWATALPGAYADDTAGDILASILGEIAALASTGADITVVNVVDGGDVELFQFDTWRFTVTDAALSLSGYETVAFVAKMSEAQTDNEALLYVRSDAAGLVRIDGAAPVLAANGTLTKTATSFTVLVAAAETGTVDVGTWTWWLKGFDTTPTPDEGMTLATGSFTVRAAGLRATT